MRNKVEEWKLIKVLNGTSILFNCFCHFMDPEHEQYIPLIFFYEDKENSYYYLKARKARYSDGSLIKSGSINKSDFDGEVLVNGTNEKLSLIENDLLIDCSQIYKIEVDYMESLIDINHIAYKRTNILSNDRINKIVEGLLWCIMQKHPYLSIIEVTPNKDYLPEANSLYLCKPKFKKTNEGYDMGYIFIKSGLVPSDFKITENKLNNAYIFCEMFLNRYCANRLEEFESIQGINNKGKKDDK